MKQIIIKIDIDEKTELLQITVNNTYMDNTKFVKVTQPNNLTEKDIKFFEDLKVLIENYKK